MQQNRERKASVGGGAERPLQPGRTGAQRCLPRSTWRNANVPANGGVFTLTQADQQGISGYNRGNPSLKAEKGRSTTLGVVLTPRSIPMLNKFTFYG